jgi:hypothetical protein
MVSAHLRVFSNLLSLLALQALFLHLNYSNFLMLLKWQKPEISLVDPLQTI